MFHLRCSFGLKRTIWRIALDAIDFVAIALPSLRSLQSPLPVNSCTSCTLGLPFKGLFRSLHRFNAVFQPCQIARIKVNFFKAFLYMVSATSKTEHEPQRRRAKRTPSLTDSTSDCAILLRSRRTKRSGITRERYLSMRVLSVSPRGADAVGSLLRGNGGMGATR